MYVEVGLKLDPAQRRECISSFRNRKISLIITFTAPCTSAKLLREGSELDMEPCGYMKILARPFVAVHTILVDSKECD